MKKLVFALLFALMPFLSHAEFNIRPAHKERIGQTEIWGEYTRGSMFDDGEADWIWKVAIIPTNTTRRELETIAKALVKAYPKKRVRIVALS